MTLPLKQATQLSAKKKRVRDLLVVAREAITDPARWTKGEFARDKDGNALRTAPQHKLAYCELATARKDLTEVSCFCGIGVLQFNANSHEDFNSAWPVLVQAVVEFKQGDSERYKEVQRQWRQVQAGDSDAQSMFFDFNDHDETTHAEVLAVYDAAIAIAAKDYADSLPAT